MKYDKKEIIKNILSENIKEDSLNLTQCPNQIVALISIDKGRVVFLKNFIAKEKRKSKHFADFFDSFDNFTYNGEEISKSIVMILESPYKDEFYKREEDNVNVAIGPACGPTGNNISRYLLSNILKYRLMQDEKSNGAYEKSSSEISEGIYKLCLINVVPFRCLYEKENFESDSKKHCPTKFKVEILTKYLEDKNNKRLFINELKNINPTIIINCSTKEIHNEINNLLRDNFCKKILLESCHPSSGYFLKGFNKI